MKLRVKPGEIVLQLGLPTRAAKFKVWCPICSQTWFQEAKAGDVEMNELEIRATVPSATCKACHAEIRYVAELTKLGATWWWEVQHQVIGGVAQA